MANWNDLFGSGGFSAKVASPVTHISTGVTGVIATITPALGNKIRLTSINTEAIQAGISININGVEVLPPSVIATTHSTAISAAGSYILGGTTSNGPYIEGGIGEALTIIKNAGNTTEFIAYTYQEGS